MTALLGSENLLDHAALLVDLDRVDRGVAGLIILLLHRAVEGHAELFDAIVEDIDEANQYRQAQPGVAQAVYQGV